MFYASCIYAILVTIAHDIFDWNMTTCDVAFSRIGGTVETRLTIVRLVNVYGWSLKSIRKHTAGYTVAIEKGYERIVIWTDSHENVHIRWVDRRGGVIDSKIIFR